MKQRDIANKPGTVISSNQPCKPVPLVNIHDELTRSLDVEKK